MPCSIELSQGLLRNTRHATKPRNDEPTQPPFFSCDFDVVGEANYGRHQEYPNSANIFGPCILEATPADLARSRETERCTESGSEVAPRVEFLAPCCTPVGRCRANLGNAWLKTPQ